MFEKITVSSTVKTLTFANYNSRQVVKALVTVEGDTIRYMLDGSTPSATDGHLLVDGQGIELANKTEMKNFKCIRVTGDATIQVSYL